MTFVAAMLLIALAAAGTIIVILMGGLYRLSVERNEANDDAERFEREADGLQQMLNETQAELDSALSRLTRKPKREAALAEAARGLGGAS